MVFNEEQAKDDNATADIEASAAVPGLHTAATETTIVPSMDVDSDDDKERLQKQEQRTGATSVALPLTALDLKARGGK